MKLTIEEIGYVDEIRARLEYNSSDKEIENMEPMERVRLLAGWFLGYESWTDTFKGYFESQGLYLTTNPEADGVLL
jgi:hypothetical protein